jgi:hypothetical protein
VDLCGPLLGVSGIVHLGDKSLVCDPLSLNFPLVAFDNDDMLLGLARLCTSLRRAVRELRELTSCDSPKLNRPLAQL